MLSLDLDMVVDFEIREIFYWNSIYCLKKLIWEKKIHS